jgi:hypothetical protein
MSVLGELGLTVADLDLGATDAEADYKLDQDFIRTRYVDDALYGQRFVFLGRKGSGKSALFRQLPALARSAEAASVFQVAPEQYAWTALKAYRERGLTPQQAHVSAWRLTLAVEIAQSLLTLDRLWPDDCMRPFRVLRRFVEDNFGKVKTQGLEAARSFAVGVESLDLSAFGVGVGLRRGTAPQTALAPFVTDLVLDQLEAPLRTNPLIVELDRLDEYWDGSEDVKAQMVGLLKAAKSINDRFRDGRGASLARIVVFLRTEIYESLRFDDKDKFRAFEVSIRWDRQGLRNLVSERLPGIATADDIFEEGRMRGGQLPFDYILSRTFQRPREVLQFVTLSTGVAEPWQTEIATADILSAEETFSSWKVDDLKQENARSNPQISALIESLRQGVHRYDSIADLESLLAEKAPEAVDELGPRQCLELLFRNSVIGFRLGGSGSSRFVSTHPGLHLPTSGAVYVHRALFRGLNLREARRTTDGSTATED